ncbi:MAG: hypothetical protein J6N76_07925, partial [Lachnospiraceae bacterium]|nr:hypothetical protein [Lachnospiraceae bacterium]
KEIEKLVKAVLSEVVRPVCVGDDFIPVYPEEQRILSELMDEDMVIDLSDGDFREGIFRIRKGPLLGKNDVIADYDLHRRTARCRIYLFGEEKLVRVGIRFSEAG